MLEFQYSLSSELTLCGIYLGAVFLNKLALKRKDAVRNLQSAIEGVSNNWKEFGRKSSATWPGAGSQ